ncbi:hypothetical protein E8E13_008092 [Curvularia kusanoi]|uniref:Uncharacterized protein n=1 Tax=Curvularia kusanoi TaxID=90978 RepID=A0A9P4TBM6_CURKU|nr:hypothetical protein E8E13_008092 [Curvularia kusanoi]
MTTVRKRAMRAFLETSTQDPRKPKSQGNRQRQTSEISTGSASSTSNQSIVFADATNVDWRAASQLDNGNERGQELTAPSTTPRQTQDSSVLEDHRPYGQETLEGLLERTLIIGPRESDQGRPLPYVREACPLFRSFGEGVDPFRTMFQSIYPRVSVERLKFLCARFFGTRAMGQHWIPTVLSAPHTFLSTLGIASAHLDTILERDIESVETSSLRQEVMHLIGQNLVHPGHEVNDMNITSLVQLIACETIGREEFSLRIHEAGLEKMIQLRGGLDQLGMSGYLASTCSWVLLESAILREGKPNRIYVEYCEANSAQSYPIAAILPESPLFRPRPRFETLRTSKFCSERCLALLEDIQAMTELFLRQSKSSHRGSKTLSDFHRDIVDKYRPISELRGPNERTKNDFRYEAVRITAILQATAMVNGLPLSEALPLAAGIVASQVSSLYRFPMGSHSNDLATSPTSPLNMRHDSMTSIATSPSYAASLASSYFDDVRSSISSNATSHPSISSSISHPSFSSTAASCSPTSPTISSQLSAYPAVSRPHQPLLTQTSFDQNPFSQHIARPTPNASTTLLKDLKVVLESSNMSECWQDMAGVLLWIGLTVGAASHKNGNRVLEKWYSALSVRASILLCFQHPEPIHSTVLKMGQIVKALGGGNAAESEVLVKRRKM